MDRQAVKDWLQDPTTRWVLAALDQRFPEQELKTAPTWDRTNRVRGWREVADFLRTLPSQLEPEAPKDE